MVVDLRSDTLTRPTTAMRRAMAEAEVGDDVFGEDPTVVALERKAAARVGHEAALFVPSGTMANQIALLVHTRPGDEVIAAHSAHTYAYESGGGAAIAGVQFQVIGHSGHFDADTLAASIHHTDRGNHIAPTRLVALENTHASSGGRVLDVEQMTAIRHVCDAHDLPVHLDGARLFNAAVARGRPAADWGRLAHTVSFCLSKGLGAPVGSVLCGSHEHLARAHRFRKMLGGGMRQVGIIAAGGVYALEHHVERLADDHRRAKRLADALANFDGVGLEPDGVETNIVAFDLGPSLPDAAAFCEAAAPEVRVLPVGARRVRAVTHLEIDDDGVERAIAVFGEVFDRFGA